MVKLGSGGKKSSVPELKWGIFESEYSFPSAPCFKAFCQIDQSTFAHSDGRHVIIWTPTATIAKHNLKAIGLHYIKSMNFIVATVQKKEELFFISLRSPYTVIKNKQLFSNKVITVIHYFEKSKVLVTAGQGLMFTKVKVPKMFNESPNPYKLAFEKITEIYDDMLFVNMNSPVFIDSKEVVAVYSDSSVKFHLLDGTCIQSFENITIAPITCISYYAQKNWLLAGDAEGRVSILHFQSSRPFSYGAVRESGNLIDSYRPDISHLLFAEVFENDFLVTIGLNRQISLFSISAEKTIQIHRTNLIPQTVYFAKPYLMIFSTKEISSFYINLFTQNFAYLSGDCVSIKRCPSSKNAARLLCHTIDSIVSVISPKTAKILFGVRALKYQYDIQNVVYPRDVIYDGISTTNINNQEGIFFRMGPENLLSIEFNPIQNMIYDPQDIFTSTTFMDTRYLKYNNSNTPNKVPYVSFLMIDTNKYPSCLIGVCRSGICYIFSAQTFEQMERFELGFGFILCAAFSTVNKKMIFSCLDHLILYDLDQQNIVSDIPHTFYRSLFVISGRTLACGGVNGALEIRSLPDLEVEASSESLEVYHSEHGHRQNLTGKLNNYDIVMDVKHSITSIDYCSPRNSLLTFSPNGEIFVWTIDAFPVCHINIDLKPTAACFLNGHGTVLLSAQRTLYTIDWKNIFNEKADVEKNELDDFDLRNENFNMARFTEEKFDRGTRMDTLMKMQQTPKSKFRKVQEDKSTASSISEANKQLSTVSPFRTIKVFDDTDHTFEDLIVEEDPLPKRHFFIPKLVPPEEIPPKKEKKRNYAMEYLEQNKSPFDKPFVDPFKQNLRDLYPQSSSSRQSVAPPISEPPSPRKSKKRGKKDLTTTAPIKQSKAIESKGPTKVSKSTNTSPKGMKGKTIGRSSNTSRNQNSLSRSKKPKIAKVEKRSSSKRKSARKSRTSKLASTTELDAGEANNTDQNEENSFSNSNVDRGNDAFHSDDIENASSNNETPKKISYSLSTSSQNENTPASNLNISNGGNTGDYQVESQKQSLSGTETQGDNNTLISNQSSEASKKKPEGKTGKSKGNSTSSTLKGSSKRSSTNNNNSNNYQGGGFQASGSNSTKNMMGSYKENNLSGNTQSNILNNSESSNERSYQSSENQFSENIQNNQNELNQASELPNKSNISNDNTTMDGTTSIIQGNTETSKFGQNELQNNIELGPSVSCQTVNEEEEEERETEFQEGSTNKEITNDQTYDEIPNDSTIGRFDEETPQKLEQDANAQEQYTNDTSFSVHEPSDNTTQNRYHENKDEDDNDNTLTIKRRSSSKSLRDSTPTTPIRRFTISVNDQEMIPDSYSPDHHEIPWAMLGSIHIKEPLSARRPRKRHNQLLSESNSLYYQNPLLYIHNYDNNKQDPYIIEDLSDPRMGFKQDKYIKMPFEPRTPRSKSMKRRIQYQQMGRTSKF